jgi:hypothetical protein
LRGCGVGTTDEMTSSGMIYMYIPSLMTISSDIRKILKGLSQQFENVGITNEKDL